MFSNFSYELRKIINDSKKEMNKLNHSYIGTEHFLLSILKSNNRIKDLLNEKNIDYKLFKDKVIENIGVGTEKEKLYVFTPLFKKILEDSIVYTNEFKLTSVELELVFKTMLDEAEGVAYRILCDLGIDINELYNFLDNYSFSKLQNNLKEFGIDLTEKAKDGLIDPVVGREKELEEIIEIILRKNKKNPILIGEAGVGKTALVESLAYKIINNEVPHRLVNKKIISISMASLVAGTKYRGEFEEKLLNIIKDIEKNNNYILFIDEIHTLVGAGGAEGAIDASNILKPALSRGNITVIGATTIHEYRKYIEDDKALSRRFQKVIIDEPTEKDLLNILSISKIEYEKYHNVIIENDTLKHIIKVSKKYFENRKEPDRSLDILDEVSSMVSSTINHNERHNRFLKNELKKIKSIKQQMINKNNFKEAIKYREQERIIESKINKREINSKTNSTKKITKEDVDNLISKKYNIVLSDGKMIKNVFAKHKKELIRYDVNKSSIVNMLLDNCMDIFVTDNRINKPISYLIPKSYLINNILNKIGKRIFNNTVNIDLNDYQDETSINKIIGAPPGYVGYNNKQTIFEFLKEKPISLILFNNYENAHWKVKEIIKQIISKGYIIDSNDYKISFMNCLIIIEADCSLVSSLGFNQEEKINNDISKYVSKKINNML